MYFIWRLYSKNVTDSLYKIIKSGYIKPSIKSKNIGLFGDKVGSKYIFLSYYSKKNKKYFSKKGGPVRFFINPFYLKKIYYNLEWYGKTKNKSVEVNTDNLHNIEKEIVGKLSKKSELDDTDILMSHEILTKKDINVKKAIMKIEINKDIEDVDNIIKLFSEKFPNIKIKKVDK